MTQYREASLDKQDSVEVKNFTRTPNMLIFGYQDISPQEKWLYVCLKHMCGKKGTRHLSLRYISEQTGISTGALSVSKNKKGEINLGMIRHLHDAGLIHAEIKRPGGKGNPQYHITITDVWALNQLFFSKTHSDFGQDEDEEPEPVRISDEPVHNSDKSVQISDEPVRISANTNTRYKTNYKTTEQDESIASPNVDASPASVTDLNRWKTDSEKRRAMFADIPLSKHEDEDEDEDISLLETRKQEATDPQKITQTPDAGTRALAADPPVGSQDDSASVQAPIVSPSSVDAAQRTVLPQAGAGAASQDGAVQASGNPPMALTAKQIQKQLERRVEEVFAIYAEKIGRRPSRSKANKDGALLLAQDDVSDEDIKTTIDEILKDSFLAKNLNLTFVHSKLDALARKPIPLPFCTGKKPSNGVDHERNQRNYEALKKRVEENGGPKLKGLKLNYG